MEDPIPPQLETASREDQAQNVLSATENYTSDNSEERLAPRVGKVMSSVAAVPNATTSYSNTANSGSSFANKSKRKREEEDFSEVSRPEIKEVFTRPEVINHNKRLFGSLMGHLGMARTKLEKDSDKIQKQKDVQTAASLRSTELLKRVDEQKELLRRKSLFQSKIDEIRSASTAWKQNLEETSMFLVTDVEPRLLWIPANANQVSRQLMKKRKEEMLRKIAERELDDNRKLQMICSEFGFTESEIQAAVTTARTESKQSLLDREKGEVDEASVS